MQTPFWISHHTDDQLFRCVSIFGMHVCARCLGLYPLLIVLMAVQAVIRAPGCRPWDIWLMAGATIPVLIDWGRAQFDPRSGNNGTRIITGALLAFPLSRTVWIHASHPLHPLAMAHLLWILTAACLILASVRVKNFIREAKNPTADSGPMPLTTEEILAGMSMSDVQERYGYPAISPSPEESPLSPKSGKSTEPAGDEFSEVRENARDDGLSVPASEAAAGGNTASDQNAGS